MTVRLAARPSVNPPAVSPKPRESGRWHASWPVLLAVCYVIWRPVSHGEILYPALALIAIAGAIDVLKPTSWIPKTVMLGSLLFFSVALAWLFYGSLRGNPGVSHQAATWVVGPLAWGLWALAIKQSTLRRVLTAIVAAGAFLSCMILLYTASETVLNITLPSTLLQGQGAGIDLREGTALRFYGLSSLAMVAPLAAAGAVLGDEETLPPRWLMVFTAIVSLLASFVSGRRAIMVIVLLLAVAIMLFGRLLRTRRKRRGALLGMIGIGALGAVTMRFAWESQLAVAVNDALATLSLASGDPDETRLEQAAELLNGFSEHPFLGSGLGAVLPSGFIRSEERPWQFELQYHAHLNALGFLGSTLLLIALGALLVYVVTVWRDNPDRRTTIVTVGAAALSIALVNATNPYLQAVGHQWAIPLLLGTCVAIDRASSRAEPT